MSINFDDRYLLNQMEADAPKPMKIHTSGIYIPQEADDLLWRSCVFSKQSFIDICNIYNNSLDKLIANGLNCNFMTRNRWFDVQTITGILKVDGPTLISKLDISFAQYQDWKLDIPEFYDLNLKICDIFTIYGKNEFINEYQRLGTIDIREAKECPNLYGITDEFLKNFATKEDLEELGWFKDFHRVSDNQQMMVTSNYNHNSSLSYDKVSTKKYIV